MEEEEVNPPEREEYARGREKGWIFQEEIFQGVISRTFGEFSLGQCLFQSLQFTVYYTIDNILTQLM